MRLQLPREAHAGADAGPNPPAALRELQRAVPGSVRRNAQPRFGSQLGKWVGCSSKRITEADTALGLLGRCLTAVSPDEGLVFREPPPTAAFEMSL